MPGSKGLNPHELAHRWVKDLGTRPDMSIKVGYISHDMRILGRIVGVRSTEQSVGIIVGGFCPQHHYCVSVCTISDVPELFDITHVFSREAQKLREEK